MGIGKGALGRYQILEKVNEGGMAEVFRAKLTGSEGFEKIVALKVLLPHFSNNKTFIDMLVDEAKIASKLSHANIARVFDLEKDQQRYFIVQEFIDGLNLRMILRILANHSIRIPVSYACHLIGKLCDGLDYAHHKTDRHGRPTPVVHRDVSPHNVLISYEGGVKIIDFGVAKAEGRTTKSVAGILKGKLAYMSPEQVRGLPIDNRSDIFACGVLLHELLTGKPLFLRKTELETLDAARKLEVLPPSTYQKEIPKELDTIVMKALERHASDRFQTTGQMKNELVKYLRKTRQRTDKTELAAWIKYLASLETQHIPSNIPPDNQRASVWSAVFGHDAPINQGSSSKKSALPPQETPTDSVQNYGLQPKSVRPNKFSVSRTSPPSVMSGLTPLASASPTKTNNWFFYTLFFFFILMCFGAFLGRTLARNPYL